MNLPVVIITGAGGGIGRAAAAALAATHRLVLVGRTESTLAQTRDFVGASAIEVADLSVHEQVERLVQRTLDHSSQIDVLIHCAGVAPLLPLEQTTPQVWQDVMQTNVASAFYLARALWPIFTRQRSGVIVNLSSMAAKDPFPGFYAYGAAKAALNNLGLSLAREGRLIGVRVYTIAPGAVETAMLRKIASVEQLPTEQTLAPEDIAKVIRQCVDGKQFKSDGEPIYLTK